MANQIVILPPAASLVRGKPMTVPITVVLESALKVRGIHAKFRGAEETQATYTTTSTDSKGRTTTHTHTAVEYVDITTQAHLLAGNERLGFFGNLSDAVATIFGGGQHERMGAGEYPFEVEIGIPDFAPPTHDGKKSRVFYELSIQVDVPAAFDLKAKQSFQVAPQPPAAYKTVPVHTRYPDDAGRGLIDSLFSPDVRLEMALAADKFRLGETIDGMFSIEADKPIHLRTIRARLVGIENSSAQGHTDAYFHNGDVIDLGTPGSVTGSYAQEFKLPAATDAPLTARGKKFSIDWFVQVELDVPWAKDPKIRAPIELLPGK